MSKVKGAKIVEDTLRRAMEVIKSPANMRKIGDQAAGLIKLRSRVGQSVSRDGAEKGAFKPLSRTKSPSGGPSYVEIRKRDKAKGKLSENTTPGKSNLTRTGQLLDSEQVTEVSYGKAAVGPKGKRSDGKTNEQIGEYVTKGGRPYNNLSKREVDRLQQTIKKQLRDLLKKVLTK